MAVTDEVDEKGLELWTIVNEKDEEIARLRGLWDGEQRRIKR